MNDYKSILGGCPESNEHHPWWERSEDVFRLALEMASKDKLAEKQFIAAITELARKNEQFRCRLFDSLRDLGKGKRGRTKRPQWEMYAVLHTVELASAHLGKGKTAGVKHAADMFKLSPKAIWSILKKAEKLGVKSLT